MTTTPQAVSRCRACRHPQVKRIDADLCAAVSTYTVAARYGLGRSGVERHRRLHMNQRIVSKYATRSEADEIRTQVKQLYGVAVDVIKKGQASGDDRKMLAALKEARPTLKLLADIVGLLERPGVNVGINIGVNNNSGVPGQEVRAALFRALDRHPEARADVVRELNKLQGAYDVDPAD